MPGGGSKPGERRGGRQKGALNHATIERILNVTKNIDEARRTGRELAVDVLERAMKLAEEVVILHKANADWSTFGDWFDRWVYCARALSKFQTPELRAILISPAETTKTVEDTRSIELSIFEAPPPEPRLATIDGEIVEEAKE